MSHKTLALKWRPRKFQEIIGQPHILNPFKIQLQKVGLIPPIFLREQEALEKHLLPEFFLKLSAAKLHLKIKTPVLIAIIADLLTKIVF